MFVVKYRKIFLSIAVAIIVLSIGCVAFLGVPIGIELTGGTATEISFEDNSKNEQIVSQWFVDIGASSISTRKIGENGFLIRSGSLSEEQQSSILEKIKSENGTVLKLSSIGPSLGAELKNKAITALIVVILAVLLYVAYVFRKVSKPVSSWTYGFITVITLIHDVLVSVAVFAIFSHYFGYEVDSLFITAILVIMGYSINDTIVVFDRVRENLGLIDSPKERNSKFLEITGKSLNQTVARSLNTSLTTLFALIALVIFTGEAVRPFSIMLIAGIIAGTYSSIFFAVPTLIALKRKNADK